MAGFRRRVLPGFILMIAGLLGTVGGPCLGMTFTFESIASTRDPAPDDLRRGILHSLLWGVPGLLLLVIGGLVVDRSRRRRPVS
jgi:hypothetical protein